MSLGLVLGLRLGGGGGIPLLPETRAYMARVQADGGEILDVRQLNDDIKILKTIGSGSLWNKFYQLLIAHGGIRRVDGLVRNWYDIISTKDVAQIDTATARPTPVKVGDLWELRFDGNDWMSGAYGESLAQPHQRIVGVKSNAATSNAGGYCDGLDGSGLRAYVGLSNVGTNRIRVLVSNGLDSEDNVATYPSFIVGTFNGTSSLIHQNGVQVASGSAGGSTAVNGLTLGKNATAAVYGNHVIWFFVQMKSGQTMTNAEANGLAAWAKARYNIDYTVR